MGGEAHGADHFEVEWEVRAVEPDDRGVQVELDLREAGAPEEVVVDLTEAQAEADALANRIRDEGDAGDTVIDRGPHRRVTTGNASGNVEYEAPEGEATYLGP
jgi:hypothetical protein